MTEVEGRRSKEREKEWGGKKKCESEGKKRGEGKVVLGRGMK